MDRVTKNDIDTFVEQYNLKDIKDDDYDAKFSVFASHLLLTREYRYQDTMTDPTRIIVESGQDLGIDGLAVIVNGVFIDSMDDLEAVADGTSKIRASFIFIQTTTSPKFDSGKILKFLNGIESIFSYINDTNDDRELKLSNPSQRLKTKIDILDGLYNQNICKKMGSQLPECRIYYVSGGEWQNDSNIVTKFESHKERLGDKSILGSIEFYPIDRQKLRELSNSNQNLEATIVFDNKVSIPIDKIDGSPHFSSHHEIEEAYIGVLKFTEFKKLIISDNGDINQHVFYNNVRDYQGENNEVNRDIKETLLGKNFATFPILNNGVTIVAQKVDRGARNELTLCEYQVVNGCQTSHILLENQTIEGIDSLYIPVKLIVTGNETVVANTIKATNYQTEVTKAELAAMTEFQKDLEKFYNTYDQPYKLFYERRSKQYDRIVNKDFRKNKVVTIKDQIKTFAAMFLKQPHKVRYYQNIVNEIGKTIFLKEHKPDPYYISSLTYDRLENFFRKEQIDFCHKTYKFHILMVFKYLVGGLDQPNCDHKKIGDYCQRIFKVLKDEEDCLKKLKESAELIRNIPEIKSGATDTRNFLKTETSTTLIFDAVKQHISSKTIEEKS